MKDSQTLLFLLTAIAPLAQCAQPIQMVWNTDRSFGPDGPWQGVVVTLGTNEDPGAGGDEITVYPGGAWDSNILQEGFCNGTTDGCLAAEAGLYDPNASPTADFDVQLLPSLGQWGSDTALNITGEADIIIDSLQFKSPATTYNIPKFVFGAFNSSNAKLPNGNYYPTQVGSLALGAPDLAQEFSEGDGSSIQGNLITGYLKNTSLIASSSWGLHIGSVMHQQSGSLTLGGYDQSRTLGTVGSFDLDGSTPVASLIDISMGVQTGGSPFNTTNITGLYQFGGNTSARAIINPALPYMFLPQATCDAIAEYLPVTYQSSSGLYTWNTNDPNYNKIVSSPAYLMFTFAESAATNFSVKVPFPLLNLTLETPILSTPQPYFPCKPYFTPDGNYHLGRAFLQATFMGVNWDQLKFFLAQAPGPNSGPSQITTIKSSDTDINANPIDTFQNSWSQTWTALPGGTSSPPSSADGGNSTSATPIQKSSSGLSDSAKIGIGVGIGILAVLLLAGVGLCLFRRRGRERQSATEQQHLQSPMAQASPLGPSSPMVHNGYDQHGNPTHVPMGEFYAPPDNKDRAASPWSSRHRTVHELDTPMVVHETGDGSLPEMPANRNSRGYS